MTDKRLAAFLLLTSLLCGCNSHYQEDTDKTKVNGPGNTVLTQQGSLHQFRVLQFIQASDVRDDIMVVRFDNFTPASSNEMPDADDDNQNSNVVPLSQTFWDEANKQWSSNNYPLQQGTYQQPRAFRVLDNNVLQPAQTLFNKPVYRAVDDNIFEQQLAMRFVWDFSDYHTVQGERNINNDRMDNLANLYGYPLLDYVNQWSQIKLETIRFSTNAKVFAASRSVEKSVFVIESLPENNAYSMDAAIFAENEIDLESALNLYSSTKLAYSFSIDLINDFTIYLLFDWNNASVRLFSQKNGSEIASANLLIDSNVSYVEIDTQSLNQAQRDALHLPAYFNPIFVGPFDNHFYVGKHYIKTTTENRDLLEPVFFFNSIAKQDIQQTFKRWREQEFADKR